MEVLQLHSIRAHSSLQVKKRRKYDAKVNKEGRLGSSANIKGENNDAKI